MFRIQFAGRLLALIATLSSAALSPALADDASTRTAKEKSLVAVLASDAPGAEKAIACKELAIYGSKLSVPELAKLLPDAQLSSWARIALEAIPDAEADQALRAAATKLDGRLLVGMLNSLGVRRDDESVELLASKLEAEDAEVASAAAVALGMIGNDAAATALGSALADAPPAVRSAVAEGYVLCAERCLAEDNTQKATEIYDAIRQADVPRQRILEATRGAILARGEAGLPLLLEQFQSPEKAMFLLALGTAREFPGNKLDAALAAELSTAPPQRAAMIVQAMADRPQSVVLSAVLKAAESGDPAVRLSAMDALARVGDGSCLAPLLEIAVAEDAELSSAAKDTLAALSGAKVDAKIAELLPISAGKKNYALLIELVGQRRIDAVPELLKAVQQNDAQVRRAALSALGETVSLKNLSVLLDQLNSPTQAADAAVAGQALRAAAIRMPDREACADLLAQALSKSPPASRTTLLEILGEMGGASALATLAEAAASSDPQLQDDSSRLLGKWNSVDAAPVLLNLAKNSPADKYKLRALRGYIGLARKFAMPEAERVEMCRQAMYASRKLDEKQLALDVLKIHPSREALQLAIQTTHSSELQAAATEAALVIAQKLASQGINVSEMLADAGFSKVKLEIIKAEYGTDSVHKDVTAILRKQAGDLPLITLSSPSYNTSFGGDPIPGSPKRLTIEYRIDGKPAKASFEENAAILLPILK